MAGEITKAKEAVLDVSADVFTIVVGAFLGRVLLRGIARFAPNLAPYHSVVALVAGIAGMMFIPAQAGLMKMAKDLSGGLAISAGIDIADIALAPAYVFIENALAEAGI